VILEMVLEENVRRYSAPRRRSSAGYRLPGPRCPARRTASLNAAASFTRSTTPSWSKGASLPEAAGQVTTGWGEELRNFAFRLPPYVAEPGRPRALTPPRGALSHGWPMKRRNLRR
jgi:hypothetical protein